MPHYLRVQVPPSFPYKPSRCSENHLQIRVDQCSAHNPHSLVSLDTSKVTIFLFALDDRIFAFLIRSLCDEYFSGLVVTLFSVGLHLTVVADIESAVYFFIQFLN